MNFGIKQHGKHAVIKINCKINQSAQNRISNLFSDLCVYEIGKNLTRIEGCLCLDDIQSFRKTLKICILKYKIEQYALEILQEKKEYDDITL